MNQKTPTLISSLFIGSIVAVFVATTRGMVFADQRNFEQAGKVSASFLDVTPSVRIAALGGDQVAARNDVSTLFSNPAGIASLQIPELWIAHDQSFVETKYDTLGFGIPIKNQVLGFAAQHIDEGSSERIQSDSSNEPVTGLGNFRFSDTVLHATWASRVYDRLMIGASLKGWQENLDGAARKGWASDVGLLAPVLPSLDLGLAYRNIGPQVEGRSLPKSLGVGGAYHLFSKGKLMERASLFTELDFAPHRNAALRIGLETQNRNFSLRAGYQNLTRDVEDPLSQFSFGGGLRIKGWRIDYAWIPHGELGDQQRLSLSFGFGMTPDERQAAARQLDDAMQKRAEERANKYFEEGQAAINKGDWQTAQLQLTQSLSWNPAQEKARSALDLANQKIKFRESQTQQETLKSLQLAKAKILKSNGAERMVDPQSEAAYDNGVRYFVKGQYQEALNEWNKISSGAQDLPYLQSYIEKAKRMKIEQEFQVFKQQNGSQTAQEENLAQQAYTLYTLGQTEKAIAAWERVLALNPKNDDAKQAIKEARAKRELVRQDPTLRKPRLIDDLNVQAMTAYDAGQLDRAATLWRRALSIEPRNMWVKNNLNRVEGELSVRNVTEVSRNRE